MSRFELFPGGELLDRAVDRTVEGVLWCAHLLTQRHVNVTPSEHFHLVAPPPDPIHLNRWESEEYDPPEVA